MRRYAWTIAVVAAFLIFIFGGTIISLYTDWLWFKDLGFTTVFSKTLVTRIGMGLIFGLAFFLVVYANLWLARYIAPPPTVRMGFEEQLGERLGRMAKGALGILLFLGSLVFAAFVGLEASTHWEEFLLYSNASSFGKADPQFGRDIGFYVFSLPFLRYLYGWLFFTFLAATVATTALHYADEKIDFIMNRPQFAPKVKTHIAVLVAMLFFIKAGGYYLAKFGLVTNPHELFYGAGYTDVHARLPVLYILMVVAILGGIMVLLNIWRRGINLAIGALVLVIAASFILGSVYPNAVQQFAVKPNEQSREKPFIQRAIAATRDAYKINVVHERQYQASGTLTPAAISTNQATIRNVRLWDYRPLQSVYNQRQALQQYYTFSDVDVDRYTLNGQVRQVLLSARELTPDQLSQSAQTWVNQKLVYTHGYGLAMSPVNEVSEEGLPLFFVRDIPPVVTVDLPLRRPEVYFGEEANNYVVVDTGAAEFNYPTGNGAETTKYKGDGGVAIGSYFRRIAFALRFSDLNLLLNSDVRSNSRVLYRRNIRERVQALMPFLRYDGDPYLVVSNGRMYWFQDAYTSADSYPYSERVGYRFDGVDRQVNYIRNSVKVITDAYTGDVRAYVSDADDPIIRTYAKIFPGIFRSLSDMPSEMLSHIRYPEDLFTIQSEIISTYHMTNPEVFYRKDDLWTVPEDPDIARASTDANSGRTRMEPNYLIMRLPGEDTAEMIILTPFTRATKDNMVAWLCAKNDPDDYGRLVLYEFPTGQLVQGPAQIAARINQNPKISQQLTLWNQQGSQVLAGSLLVLPIEGTIMYVVPLYLQATGAKIPELQRVIVAVGNRIAMEETFPEALSQVVGSPIAQPAAPAGGVRPTAEPVKPVPSAQPTAPAAVPPAGPEAPADVRKLVQQANEQLTEAERSQREGDWAGYGKQIGNLKRTLEELQRVSGGR